MKAGRVISTIFAALAFSLIGAAGASAATTLVQENFDTAPGGALPAGWTEGGVGGPPWATTATSPVTGSKSVAIAGAAAESFRGLLSPPFFAPATPITITFKHKWAWEAS